MSVCTFGELGVCEWQFLHKPNRQKNWTMLKGGRGKGGEVRGWLWMWEWAEEEEEETVTRESGSWERLPKQGCLEQMLGAWYSLHKAMSGLDAETKDERSVAEKRKAWVADKDTRWFHWRYWRRRVVGMGVSMSIPPCAGRWRRERVMLYGFCLCDFYFGNSTM